MKFLSMATQMLGFWIVNQVEIMSVKSIPTANIDALYILIVIADKVQVSSWNRNQWTIHYFKKAT